MQEIFSAVSFSGLSADVLSGVMFVLLVTAIGFVTRLIIALIFPQAGIGGTNDD